MSKHELADIRNIALVGAAGAGKTSLVESLLYAAGALKQKGSIAKGTTVCDYLPLEVTQKHSLAVALAECDHAGVRINLLDTPGSPDFIGRTLAVLPAVETVAVVVHAAHGPDIVARRLMVWAKERGLDRVVIINHIDAAEADPEACLGAVRAAFGQECLPLNLPANRGTEVIDCFFKPDGARTDFGSVSDTHTHLIDQVVELDDALMELYLGQGEVLEPRQLHDAFERALREGHLVPVCFTSAQTDAGIKELLKIVVELMPNPIEGNPPDFYRGDGDSAELIHFTPNPDGHVLAHVFRIAIDPFVGRIALFRIHQGTVTKDSQLYIGDGRKPFRVGHLLKPHGRDSREIEAATAGDICAVAKIEDIRFDDVLHDSHDEDRIHLKPIVLPAPMQGVAIAAKTRGDEQKISDALAKLQAEDPSIRIEHNHALNETVLWALGDLHLRILLHDLKERFHVEVQTRPPKIAYKETVAAAAEGHYRHKKQSGGAGQFGEVTLRVKPLARGDGFRFVDDVVGGVIPRQFIPAVEKGVRQAVAEGVVAGYEMQDLEVSVYDGKYHAVDSKEIAFVTAGRKAFIDAVQKAHPVVLEPIVNLNISAPSGSMGDITGDLSSKRGRINSTVALDSGMTAISAQVPLAELNGYQSLLKSITGGAGSFVIELSHYDPVPARVQQELRDAYRPRASED